MKRTVILLLFLALVWAGRSQVIWSDPVFPKANEPVTIYFDAAKGNGGLAGCNCAVYVHTGVLTNLSPSPGSWRYVQTEWGVANPEWQMQPVAGRPDVYSYVISPSIRDFYGVPVQETITDLAFVFRNGGGTLEGKGEGGADLFYPVYPEDATFSALLLNPTITSFLLEEGDAFSLEAASSRPADWTLTDNGFVIDQQMGTEYTYSYTASGSGSHELVLTAAAQGDTETFSIFIAIPLDLPAEDPPAGTEPGITYPDDQSARLALFAPGKETIFIMGDFNDWQLSTDYQMKTSLDGQLHWLEVDGLVPGEQYGFQYLVDGNRRIGDPYSQLVLDPFNDGFIPHAVFPGLKQYPIGKTTGIVSVLQAGAEAYPWLNPTYVVPPREELTVYELLLRDFLDDHSYQSLEDTLDYLQALGVNAIELMPVNEFEGNISWGYNPSYHLALDKYYGSPEAFKAFVDACHGRDIAVILDVVYNHAFSQSPLCQLYWDDDNFRPAPDNPWLNPTPRHDFNVGYDFNHESPATRYFVKRALEYWLDEYHIDGFRFDLSKGFTQVNTLGDVGLWGQYDASRVAILKDYADHIWSVNSNAFVILEHFADNTEETELIEYGMLVWGNLNHSYSEASKAESADLSWSDYKDRGWNRPGAVVYMESHDEERVMVRNLAEGRRSLTGNYNIRELPVALARQELTHALLLMTPGPKMIWQFGEMGYDYSINYCEDGTVRPDCRLSPKPVRWDYLRDPDRNALFNVVSGLNFLRNNYPVFHTTDYTVELQDPYRKYVYLEHPDMDAFLVANLQVSTNNVTLFIGRPGTWYDYFTGDSLAISVGPRTFNLQPGEYKVYTSEKLPPPPSGYSGTVGFEEILPGGLGLEAFPNPARNTLHYRFQIEKGGLAEALLLDPLGRRARTLFRGQLSAGEHSLAASVDELATGLYQLLLKVDGKVDRLSVQVDR